MLKISQKHRMYSLMGLSILGLSTFFAYWLKHSYDQEKVQIQRDANFLLMSSVREVEDSLMQTNPWRVSNVVQQMKLSTDDTVKLGLRVMFSSDSVKGFRVPHGPMARSKTGRKGERRIPGMIGYFIFDNYPPKDDSVLDIPTAINSLLVNHFNLVKDEMNVLQEGEMAFDMNAEVNKNSNIVSSRVYQDLMTGTKAKVVIRSFNNIIIKKLMPKIFVSLAILLLTLFSFFLLYKSAREQRRLAESREALIANITHELNTPITSASLALESLQTRSMDAAGRSEYLMLAAGEIKRLSSLVEKIMAGVDSENKKSTVRQELNVNKLILDVIASMKLKIEQMNGNVDVHSNEIDISVWGDRLELTGVIQNLIDNALKYSQPKPEIDIELNQSDQYVIITISDNGIGIPIDFRSQVFEPFYRVPTGNRHDVKGHGLGLNFVKKIVEAHKGTISILDADRGGIMVEIKIPKKST